MKPIHFVWLPTFLAVALATVTVNGANDQEKRFTLPDAAFDAIVKEMNANIREELTAQGDPWDMRLRSSALMIALATQHRMFHKQGDARQLATMRDAAVRMARAIDFDTGKRNMDVVRKQAEILDAYPQVKENPEALMEILKLKGIFEQEDIDFHFARKRKQIGIERELFAITRATKPPPMDTASEKIALTGYKVALLAEMLREFDDRVRPQKVNQRKEWVAHATDAQYVGWQLAEAANAKDGVSVKSIATRMLNACSECHAKFRCD